MRAELLYATQEKNEALQKFEESQRRGQLLKSDLESYKLKANKLQTEKMQLERDYRSAQALYGSMQGSVNMDVEYYKRKVRWIDSRKSRLLCPMKLVPCTILLHNTTQTNIDTL